MRHLGISPSIVVPTESGRKHIARTLVACGSRVRPTTIEHLAESKAVLEGLATQMQIAVDKATSSDGRIDWRMAAAHLYGVMKENQR